MAFRKKRQKAERPEHVLFAEEMMRACENPSRSIARRNAEDVMCDVLAEMGYGSGVRIFKQMEFR